MISSVRIFGLVASLVGPFTLTLGSYAMAQEATVVGSRNPIWTLPWRAVDRCAAYGPEFTSVEGTNACVRIGGHVRVEFGAQNLGHAVNNGWGRTAPAAMRTDGPIGNDPADFPQTQHLHLREDDSPTSTGSYLR